MNSTKNKTKKLTHKSEKDIFNINGVEKLEISEATQEYLNCVIGKHLHFQLPYTLIEKNLIVSELNLNKNRSDFFKLQQEILKNAQEKFLIGYLEGDVNEFFICLTENSTNSTLKLLKQLQNKNELIVKRKIYKYPKAWNDLGSALIVDENLELRSRPFLQVEINTKYPVPLRKKNIQFRIRNPEEIRDGYLEFHSYPDFQNINKSVIDTGVQVSAPTSSSSAQTNFMYPTNIFSEYKYEIDPNNVDGMTWSSGEVQNIFHSLNVNNKINLHKNDFFLNLNLFKQKTTSVFDFNKFSYYINANKSNGKTISDIVFTINAVAVSYCNCTPNLRDYSENYVLLWNTLNPFKPEVILYANRDITCLEFCQIKNILIGGGSNGQLFIWALNCTEKKYSFPKTMHTFLDWRENMTQVESYHTDIESDLNISHTKCVSQINLIEGEENGSSLKFVSSSLDGSIKYWNLTIEKQMMLKCDRTIPVSHHKDSPLKRPVSSCIVNKDEIYLGTLLGEFMKISYDSSDSFESQLDLYKKFHTGPILSMSLSSGVIMTVGGNIFALWHDEYKSGPFIWRKTNTDVIFSKWHNFEPHKFTVVLQNGSIEIWTLQFSSKTPIEHNHACSSEITSILIQKALKGQNIEYWFGTEEGMLQNLPLDFNEDELNKSANMKNFDDFVKYNVEKKNKLRQWCQKWEVNDKSDKPVNVPFKKSLTKVKLLPKTHLKKEDEELKRMKKIILKKKQFNIDEIEKNRQPLVDLKKLENSKKNHRQKIFAESEMRCENEIKELLPRDAEVPSLKILDGNDVHENQKQIFDCYEKLCTSLKSKIRKYEYDFNYANVLIDARKRYQTISAVKTAHWERHKIFEW